MTAFLNLDYYGVMELTHGKDDNHKKINEKKEKKWNLDIKFDGIWSVIPVKSVNYFTSLSLSF